MKAKLLEYRTLLESFLSADYKLFPFIESPPEYKALLLRHDIDFDLQLARDMGELENRLGVQSTYFFMLRSPSYNLLERNSAQLVSEIRDQGHHISLHFDPTNYDDFHEGLGFEIDIFHRIFGLSPECITLHRPTEFFLQYDAPIGNIRHT